jgi:hypothetical protein
MICPHCMSYMLNHIANWKKCPNCAYCKEIIPTKKPAEKPAEEPAKDKNETDIKKN